MNTILKEPKTDLDWQLPGCPLLAGGLKGWSGAPRQTVPMPGGQRQTDGADAGPVPASHTCTYRQAQSAMRSMSQTHRKITAEQSIMLLILITASNYEHLQLVLLRSLQPCSSNANMHQPRHMQRLLRVVKIAGMYISYICIPELQML